MALHAQAEILKTAGAWCGSIYPIKTGVVIEASKLYVSNQKGPCTFDVAKRGRGGVLL